MARAKYQVLVIPYRKNGNIISYCIFKRSDMDECWQFVAGGGEDEDKTPLASAQREAFEEAGISSQMHFTELETKCSISTEYFKNARTIWGEDCLVIPEYCFAVKMQNEDISISHEHGCFEWVDYSTAKERLKYDSNKVALWELDNKIKRGIIN
ncbi:MAG: NUDIX domain-containing protein [Oscillospiraceae bacterium]|nr:NUDIX domain-containing protein [Oscillospiraceae bacterium]